MKKVFIAGIVLLLLAAVLITAGCTTATVSDLVQGAGASENSAIAEQIIKAKYLDVTGMELLPVEILADYRKYGASGIVDLGTFSAEETKLLNEAGIASVNAANDGWNNPSLQGLSQGSACSCCIKMLDDGTLVMGRNMDAPIGFGPVTIFRTEGNGKDTYDTINVGYIYPETITFDQVAEIDGIPKDLFTNMAMTVTDVVNSEGLYLEFNGRDSTECPSSSTNPDGSFRTCVLSLNRLIGDHCATIEEALEYVKTIDIYDPKSAAFSMSMAIGMVDKTGRYGVLEFSNNKIIWNEGKPGYACGQCNFYWNEDTFKHARWQAGIGRWQKLMEYYNDIETEDDMADAMERVWYSNLYTDGSTAKDWKVNWMSEMIEKDTNGLSEKWVKQICDWRDHYGIYVDEEELARAVAVAEKQKREGIVWDLDYLNTPESFYDVFCVMDLFTKAFVQTPVEVQKSSGFMEAASISYTANSKEIGYTVRFFEMNDVFHLGLHDTTIDRIPATKSFGPKC